MRSQNRLGNIDYLTVLLYLLLVFLGWISIYAAVYNEEHQSILDATQKYGKQLTWIVTSLFMAGGILLLDGRIFEKFAWPIYGVTLLLLIGVLLFGKEVNGARSWYAIGSFSLQPSEFAKIGAALALAKYLNKLNVDWSKLSNRIISLAIIFTPAVLIAPQPDLGSSLVYASLLLVLYREGLPGKYIFAGLGLAVLFILSLLIDKFYLGGGLLIIALILAIVGRRNRSWVMGVSLGAVLAVGFIGTVDYAFNNLLEDRHRNRINILLGKAHDPKGIGYNTNQSMIAIGSGGFSGKGFLKGTQTKFNFVPEQSTDFIFCTVGEEFGFLGTAGVITLFIVLLFRLVFLAERQKSTFSRVYGYCVASILFLHFSVNIAMTIGLAPVVGIPLPFFSYGGSSLWGFTLLLFIFIRLDSYRLETL
ncbi:MAG: rod shape-determining protein RodA [Schleiferiaceae bacterium]